MEILGVRLVVPSRIPTRFLGFRGQRDAKSIRIAIIRHLIWNHPTVLRLQFLEKQLQNWVLRYATFWFSDEKVEFQLQMSVFSCKRIFAEENSRFCA